MKIQVKRAIFKIFMNKCDYCRNFKVNPLNANNFYNFAYDSSEEMRYKCAFVSLFKRLKPKVKHIVITYNFLLSSFILYYGIKVHYQ